MRFLLLSALFIAFLLSTLNAQPGTAFCDQQAIPTTWPTSLSKIIGGTDAIFSSYPKLTEARISMTNLGTKPIVKTELVVEFYDADSRHLLSMPVYSVSKDFLPKALRVAPFFNTGEVGVGGTILFPHDSVTFNPRSAIISRECPARARVEMLNVWYFDGTSSTYSSGQWRTDPKLIRVDEWLSTTSPMPLPYDKVLKLAIDKTGILWIREAHDFPQDFPKWLNSKMQNWKFTPATYLGTAVSSDFPVLFRFHSQRKEDWSGVGDLAQGDATFSVVDIYPQGKVGEAPEIFYGGLPVSTEPTSATVTLNQKDGALHVQIPVVTPKH
ncbi:MAG TPA: hypothetical protein VGR50_01410 [Terriglobales bacterium]|nr:hypothetical protein [Terriglobales bacterium]